ncbi:endonuclease/exonuclease/phosphatase family protein [Kribbella sp. NPDC054772]
MVVAGDLNTPPGHPELQPLLAVLDDCWQPTAYDGATYSSRNPHLRRGEWLEEHRIDYIFTGGMTATSARLAGFDEDHGRPPSDHYAVVTDVPLR